MKVRNGFVSNSSTSSFVVVGFDIEDEEQRHYEDEIDEHEVYGDMKVHDLDGSYMVAESLDGETLEDITRHFNDIQERFPTKKIVLGSYAEYG